MRTNKLPEERRQEIVDVAKELFIEHGFEKTSVSQIAKNVGVVKGLFYYYFETKEDVLDSVIEDLCNERIGVLNQKLALVEDDFFAQLLVLVDVYSDVHPHLHWRKIKEFTDTRLIVEFHTRYLEKIQEILHVVTDKGKELGHFDLEYPEVMVASALEGIYGISRLMVPSQTMVATIIEQTLNLPHGCLVEKSHLYLQNFVNEEG